MAIPKNRNGPLSPIYSIESTEGEKLIVLSPIFTEIYQIS